MKLAEYSERQLEAELKKRRQQKLLTISDEDYKTIDQLYKETRKLSKGEIVEVTIGSVKIGIHFCWESDIEASMYCHSVKNSRNDKESKFLERAIVSYIEDDIWELHDISAVKEAYKAFDNRIKAISRASDKLADKYKMDEGEFFEEFIK